MKKIKNISELVTALNNDEDIYLEKMGSAEECDSFEQALQKCVKNIQ